MHFNFNIINQQNEGTYFTKFTTFKNYDLIKSNNRCNDIINTKVRYKRRYQVVTSASDSKVIMILMTTQMSLKFSCVVIAMISHTLTFLKLHGLL